MPASKNPRVYPEPFADLVRVAATKPISIPTSGAKEASQLRGHLYGYFGALKAATHQKDCDPETRELHLMAEKVQIVLGDNNTVVARPRDMDPRAKLVTEALRAQTNLPLPASDALQPSADLAALATKSKEE